MLVDGKAIAADILRETKERLEQEGRTLTVRAVVVRPTSATESYLKIKEASAQDAGMQLEVVRVPDTATDADVIAAVRLPGADAVIVQLPLPESFDTTSILNTIPLNADADVLSEEAYARFAAGEEGAPIPPVADAVDEILRRCQVEVAGKNAVVVGVGKLVGKPCAALLTVRGAQVTVVRRSTEGKEALFKEADIIVSGAGTPNFITSDMVKDGAVLIDAGTSGVAGGVAGDFDPGCADKASVFTPVPGGVGPIAVACLYKNAALLLR